MGGVNDAIRERTKEKEDKYSSTAEEIKSEGFQTVSVYGLSTGARGIMYKGLVRLKSLGFSNFDCFKVRFQVRKFG